MTGRPVRRAHTVLALAAASSAGAAVVVLALASASSRPEAGTPAAARGLVASDPADRAVLAAAPQAVELVFPAPINTDLSHVAVLVDGGASAGTGALVHPAPDTVRQPVAAPGPGTFTVAYHVTFTDGAQVAGLLRFSVGTGVPPPTLDATGAERAAEAAAVGHPHSIDPLSAVLLVLDGLVGVAVVALLLRRRRPTP